MLLDLSLYPLNNSAFQGYLANQGEQPNQTDPSGQVLATPRAQGKPYLRVSFDLDDTLTCHCASVPRENGLLHPFIHRRFMEPLRLGTVALMRELRRRGCGIWIYTTSSRTPAYIRRWLLLHGVRVDGVVNSQRHRDHAGRFLKARLPSKFPPAFGIDLHVDDSEGVRMEGEDHGFQVLVVDPHDKHWTERVLKAVTRLQAGQRLR